MRGPDTMTSTSKPSKTTAFQWFCNIRPPLTYKKVPGGNTGIIYDPLPRSNTVKHLDMLYFPNMTSSALSEKCVIFNHISQMKL